MPKLPGISQKDAVRVFQKLGYTIRRQGKHIFMTKDDISLGGVVRVIQKI